jgi:hypothetical protein
VVRSLPYPIPAGEGKRNFFSLDGRFIHRRIKLKIPSFSKFRMVSEVEPPPAGERVKE